MSDIVGKPVIVDELKPELAARLVKLIIDDNERARSEREKKRRQKEKKRKTGR